jgi:hypothetical protein
MRSESSRSQLAATLVREATLLGDVRRERIRLRACDGDAELLGLHGGLLFCRTANRAPSLGHELLRPCGSRVRATE